MRQTSPNAAQEQLPVVKGGVGWNNIPGVDRKKKQGVVRQTPNAPYRAPDARAESSVISSSIFTPRPDIDGPPSWPNTRQERDIEDPTSCPSTSPLNIPHSPPPSPSLLSSTLTLQQRQQRQQRRSWETKNLGCLLLVLLVFSAS